MERVNLMGLPQINIEFKGKATSAVSRSSQGVVALILRDTTNPSSNASMEYKSIEEVKKVDYTTENYAHIERAFLGTPSKVIVEVLKNASELPEKVDISLKRLKSKRWNYLAFPEATDEEKTSIVTFITTERGENNKSFKAVLANKNANHEGIIDFATEGIQVGEETFTAAEYTPRIAGILAGLSFTQSATYYVLDEVEGITESETPNDDIDGGKLILINDGESIKIGRGVNSLVTPGAGQTEDFKKIKIIEVMDMIKSDIRDTFDRNYVGKVPNTYDNQVLFFAAVNAYLKTLENNELLDPTYENVASVNVEAQRAAWESAGTDTTDWDDLKVKNMTFKSNVFAGGNVKIVDATEDLDFQITI